MLDGLLDVRGVGNHGSSELECVCVREARKAPIRHGNGGYAVLKPQHQGPARKGLSSPEFCI